MVCEPLTVYPEEEFQKAVVSLIEDILRKPAIPFVIIQKSGLDVAVFPDAAAPVSAVRLFEVRAYARQRMGAVGFGNGHGFGPQVDLLLRKDSEFRLFESSARWVFADATQQSGTCRCSLCATAKKAAMGSSVAREKQNNLRISALSEILVDWGQLREAVGGSCSRDAHVARNKQPPRCSIAPRTLVKIPCGGLQGIAGPGVMSGILPTPQHSDAAER
jgi:hypothetical protein